MFADFLEKGVIRRARVHAAVLPRENDVELAIECCRAIEQLPTAADDLEKLRRELSPSATTSRRRFRGTADLRRRAIAVRGGAG